jgi:RNA polymerase-binding transcription factor DksA
MRKKKIKAVPKESEKPCVECGEPIPEARLKLVNTDLCVVCLHALERMGKGTVRHKMEFEIEGTEEVESIELHLKRSNEVVR